MTVSRLRVGIVGAGWVATARHIPAFRLHPAVDLVAVCDHNADRARQVSAAHAVPAWFDDIDRFLDADLDIVSICTPPWTHAEIAITALSRGRNVFTEKPMAMDSGDARAMVDAASAADRMLCVSHNLLFSRSVRKAGRVLGDRAVTYGIGIQLSSTRRRLPTWHHLLPGGLFTDEVPHMLYTLAHFLGPLELDDVRAVVDAEGAGTPVTADIRVRGTSGSGQLTTLFRSPVSEWHVALVSDDAVVDLDLFRDIAISVGSDGAHQPADVLRTSAAALMGHGRGVAASGHRYLRGRLLWGHDEIIREFVDAILDGKRAPVPAEDALAVVGLTDQILAAIGARRPLP